MTGTPDHHDSAATPDATGETEFRYPTNHLLAVLDTRAQAKAAVDALTAGGFLRSEIEVRTGAEAGDALDASTGRRGLVAMVIRGMERLGLTNEEMETKNRYEDAMRDDQFVLAVAAPTDERKERATQILREHGAHTVAFFGKFSIEYIVRPARR